jgi:hypothetical protein
LKVCVLRNPAFALPSIEMGRCTFDWNVKAFLVDRTQNPVLLFGQHW